MASGYWNGHRSNGPNGNGARNGHRYPPGLLPVRRPPRRSPWRPTAFATLILTLGLTGLVLFVLFGLTSTTLRFYAAVNADLPPAAALDQTQSFKTVQVFDRKGRLLWEFNDPNGGLRTPVPLDQVSQHVVDATLAAEDPNFFSNAGVDLRAVARAIVQNVARQEVVSGASTITQQVVRNLLIPGEKYDRSILRKVKEAVLAYHLTTRYSKTQVLEVYLNEIYYGHQAYGIEAAAQTYFNKHAKDLTLAEAALLAGLPQAPDDYDPLKNLPAAVGRQQYVLDQMVRYGFITPEQAEEARRTPLAFHPREVDLRAPHFVMYLRDYLEQRYGTVALYQRGLRVYTTLDLDLQDALQQVLASNVDVLKQRDATSAAILVADPRTGELLAMHGSLDYWNAEIHGQVNVLTSERGPGSAIKPIVYATAFTLDYSPATVIDDTPTTWRDGLGRPWTPQNFDLRFHGPVTARTALGNSLNVPAIKVLEHAGVDRVVEQARRMGITTWGPDKFLGLPLTLGGAEVRPIDLVQAYTVFPNLGMKIPLTPIRRIVDYKGDVIEDYRVPPGEQVLDPRAAYQITSILSDDASRRITYGYPSRLRLDRPAAAKTGTTEFYRDTWTIGYTPNLIIGVWVGNADGRPMKEIQSSMSAGKIWREAMETAFRVLELPVEDFARPDGLVERPVCEPNQGNRPPGNGCWNDLFWAERADQEYRNVRRPAALPRPAPTPVPTPNQPPAAQPTPAPSTPGPTATRPAPAPPTPQPSPTPRRRAP